MSIYPVVLPNYTLAVGQLAGGKLAYRDGAIEVPAGPGLGVELDREKLGLYSELFKSMGGYQYDRDPERPRWFALVPNDRWHAVS
jgi:glucarate dehydratase